MSTQERLLEEVLTFTQQVQVICNKHITMLSGWQHMLLQNLYALIMPSQM